MKKWAPIVLNVLLFQSLWTLSVLGAGTAWWWAAPTLILASAAAQLRWSPAPRVEAAVILLGAAAGFSLDAAAMRLGMFRYASGSPLEFAIVFLLLWVNFGTTLRPSLRWIWGRPLVGAALGGVGGPLTYWVGARLGAIAPVEPAWRAFVWCGVQYAVAVPAWCSAASWAFSAFPEAVRPSIERAEPRSSGTPSSPGSPGAEGRQSKEPHG